MARLSGVTMPWSRRRHGSDNEVELSLDIRVPRMDNYTYQLLLLKYNMTRLYPVVVVSTHAEWEDESCQNTEELKVCLSRLFRHPDTKNVIAALRAHAEDPRARLRESRRQAEAKKESPPPPNDDDLPF
jgi:chemotaxis response regulator CheB